MKRYATRRLLLRPPAPADAPAIFAHGRLEEVAFPAGFPRHETQADARRYVRGARREWKRTGLKKMAFAITLKRDGTWIGGANLRWPHAGVGELGYSLHPDYWGRGYAAEAARVLLNAAFAEFGAHRVQATCWVKNRRSAAVLRKLGLKREGRLRGYMKRGDVVRDEFIWGVTREDWRAGRRGI